MMMTNLASRIYGCQNAALVYSAQAFDVTSDRENISLMPLRQCITYSEFIDELLPRIRGVQKIKAVSALCILRQGLCTSFLQNVESIFHLGVRGIFCYDNIWQVYCDDLQMFDFTGVNIEHKKISLSEAPIMNFAISPGGNPNTRIAPVYAITDMVREALPKYPSGLPACLIAEDMLKGSSIKLKMHVVARAIRREREQESMQGFPLLHELVLWVVKTKDLDVYDDGSYPTILKECAGHIPEGSYLNFTNIRKVVKFIKPRLAAA